MKTKPSPSCEIEAIVSFDDRGQLVIPKDLRKKFKLKPGDKFALVSCMTDTYGADCCADERSSRLCCLTLVRTDQMTPLVQQSLAPVMSALFQLPTD